MVPSFRSPQVIAALVLLATSPCLAQQPAPGTPATVPAVDNPNLAVAAVKAENGVRASQIIGAGVYGDGSDEIGTVDDLILTPTGQVTLAVVAVGGVIGIGSKRVAVPFDQLKRLPEKIVVPGATKESFGAMPTFMY